MRSLLGSLVSRHDFAGIFRSWGSMAMLMPVGGEGIWGNGSHAPDGHHLGHMLTFTRPPTPPPPIPSKEGEDASKPHAAKAIVSNATAPKAAQAAAKAAAHASELAAAAIAAATLAVKSGTNPDDDPDVQRATEASEALAVSKAKQEAIATEESLRASARDTASSVTSSSKRGTVHESTSAKKSGAPPLEPNGLSEARRRSLLGLDRGDFDSDIDIASDNNNSDNFDNNNYSSKSANDSNGSCINGSSDNNTKSQQQLEHVNQTGLTATGALSLLREVAPHYGELFDANYDFRGRLEMQGKGNKKFWKPRASKRAPTSDPKASASLAAAAAREGKDGRVKPWRAGAGSSTSWHNPLARPLPPAPGLTMYCFHGTGLPTDRAYVLSGARDYRDDKSSSQPPSHPSAPSPPSREDGNEKHTSGSSNRGNVTTNISSGSSASTTNMSNTVATSSGSADTYQNTLPFEVDVSAHDPSNGLHHGVSS